MLTPLQASAIYDILVREVGASNREYFRTHFVNAVTREESPAVEYSFRGSLGSRARIIIESGIWFVLLESSDVPFDALIGIAARTNDALTSLKAHYDALSEALI